MKPMSEACTFFNGHFWLTIKHFGELGTQGDEYSPKVELSVFPHEAL
jgi:hypothetical protein